MPLIVLLLLTHCAEQNWAQTVAAIVDPRELITSLDDGAVTTFQCNATNAVSILWSVDGVSSLNQEVADRGIMTTPVVTVNDKLISSLSIPRSTDNDNTTIICRAVSLANNVLVRSELAFFRVQGLLDPPPNTALSEVNEQFTRTLSWDKPFSLNITDIEPDISHYQVCYNFSVDTIQCLLVNETEFTFLNVHVPLLFSVSAVNVVGVGDASSIRHLSSSCIDTGDLPAINASEVQCDVLFVQFGNNVTAVFLFNQTTNYGEDTCFFIYKINTTRISESVSVNGGEQIPGIVNTFDGIIQLSLIIDSGLVDNEIYSSTIITISSDGSVDSIGSIEFNTYDVQSVSGSAIIGGLELSCTFATGSQARSCLLTISGLDDDCNRITNENVTITRSNNLLTSSGQKTVFCLGVYTIIEVFEVESDGTVTTVESRGPLQIEVTDLSPVTTTSSTPGSPLTDDVSEPSSNVGAIIGGSVVSFAVLLVLTVVVVTAVIIIGCKWYNKQQTTRVVYDEPTSISMSNVEPDMEQCPAYGVLNR